MAELIHQLQDRIDQINEEIENDAELILKQIDLDELLKDPNGYLSALAQAFMEQHIDEIQEGANAGARYAEKVLTNS